MPLERFCLAIFLLLNLSVVPISSVSCWANFYKPTGGSTFVPTATFSTSAHDFFRYDTDTNYPGFNVISDTGGGASTFGFTPLASGGTYYMILTLSKEDGLCTLEVFTTSPFAFHDINTPADWTTTMTGLGVNTDIELINITSKV